MLRLLLLRHAKAENAEPGQIDHTRNLAAIGRADAQKIGRYLTRHGLTPDFAVVSTATRARETWESTVAGLGKAPSVSFDERIYNASPQSILETIKETRAPAATLLTIGHNPGIHELATMLVASGDIDARQRLAESFPTTALAVIGFAVEDWNRLHPQSGRLEHFITPQTLEMASD